MHPTTPFKTNSWTVRVAELIGWALLIPLFYFKQWQGLSLATQIATTCVWAGYLFMRGCSLYRCHAGCSSDEGLGRQFQQMAVAACYGWCVTNLCATGNTLTFLIYFIAVVLLTVSAINAILIYLYCKDSDTTPINYYSHHKFQREDA